MPRRMPFSSESWASSLETTCLPSLINFKGLGAVGGLKS